MTTGLGSVLFTDTETLIEVTQSRRSGSLMILIK